MLRRFWALKRLRTSLQIPLASRRGSSVHCEKLRLLKSDSGILWDFPEWNQDQIFFVIVSLWNWKRSNRDGGELIGSSEISASV